MKRKNNIKSDSYKFMQALSKSIYNEIETLATKRGITAQEYIRAIIIPQYFESLPKPVKKYSNRAKKAWTTRRRNQKWITSDQVDLTPKVPVAPPQPLFHHLQFMSLREC